MSPPPLTAAPPLSAHTHQRAAVVHKQPSSTPDADIGETTAQLPEAAPHPRTELPYAATGQGMPKAPDATPGGIDAAAEAFRAATQVTGERMPGSACALTANQRTGDAEGTRERHRTGWAGATGLRGFTHLPDRGPAPGKARGPLGHIAGRDKPARVAGQRTAP